MSRLRNAFVAVLMAATLAVLGGASAGAWAQEKKAAKVSYAPIPGGDYNIDPAHSRIGFSIRHLEIAWVEGRFKDVKGTIRFDEKDVTKSSVEFAAKVESIDTGVEARD